MTRPAVSITDPILLQWYALEVLIGLTERLVSLNGEVVREIFAGFLREPSEESWKIAASNIASRLKHDDPEQPTTFVIYPEEASVWAPDPNKCRQITESCLETCGSSILFAFVVD